MSDANYCRDNQIIIRDMKYLIRSLKYFIFICVFFAIVVLLLYYTSAHSPETTVFDLFKEGAGLKILIFFVAVAAIYPLFGFVKKDIYTNNNFQERKDDVVKLLREYKYEVVEETSTSITFRHRNMLVRVMRMFEDRIVIDFSGNPVIIDGVRKDVYRFARLIERVVMRDRDE